LNGGGEGKFFENSINLLQRGECRILVSAPKRFHHSSNHKGKFLIA
jgi:hypothetical protein